jgi:hypothetical protein
MDDFGSISVFKRPGTKLPNTGALVPGKLNAYLAPPHGIDETLSRIGSPIARDAASQKVIAGDSFIPRGFVL